MKCNGRILLVAVVVGGLTLAGCDADNDGVDDQTGKPVAISGNGSGGARSGDCDPNGFGPLSGCEGAKDADRESTAGDDPVGLGTTSGNTEWVVSGFGYAGPRDGPGRYYVECQPIDDAGHDQTEYGHGAWKEVDGYRDDGTLSEGDRCPAGGTVYDDGPIREDGAR